MSTPAAKFDRGSVIASVVSAVIIIVVGIGGSLLLWSVRAQLPAEVATHWGADGRADGFRRLSELFVENAVVCGVIPLFLVVVGLVMKQGRLMGPISVATAIFMTILIDGAIWAQRGMSADQVAESDPTMMMIIAFVVSIVVGAGLWAIFRRRGKPGIVAADVDDSAPRLLVDDAVQLAWTGRTRVPAGALVALGIGAVSTTIPMVLMVAAGNWGMAAMMAVLTVVIGALGAGMSATVTVDGRGVRARGLGFITWVNVPLETIAGATVTTVSPLGDFGGWGYRIGLNGDVGFVTSSGPALRIDRGDEPHMLITLAEAEAAVATLNTLVARRGRDNVSS